MSHGSTWFDLLVHIWDMIDSTMTVDYGEKLGLAPGCAWGCQPKHTLQTHQSCSIRVQQPKHTSYYTLGVEQKEIHDWTTFRCRFKAWTSVSCTRIVSTSFLGAIYMIACPSAVSACFVIACWTRIALIAHNIDEWCTGTPVDQRNSWPVITPWHADVSALVWRTCSHWQNLTRMAV